MKNAENEARNSRVFGRRATRHTIIIASGDRIRHVTVQPWVVAIGACFVGVFAIGYLIATTYLVLRDDLIGATMARQARMQHSYEDRIAALRAQVDRVTSRQLLDQQAMEDRVAKLYERQLALSSRHGLLGPLMERASSSSGIVDQAVPVPAPKPGAQPAATMPKADRHASAAQPGSGLEAIAAAAPIKTASVHPAIASAYVTPRAPLRQENIAERADRVFGEVSHSLKAIEKDQIQRLKSLTSTAVSTAGAIRTVVDTVGLRIAALTAKPAAAQPKDGIGGPFVRADLPENFDASLSRLDRALNDLESVRRQAEKLPFGRPVKASFITSSFGSRRDPFFERRAFHSGIDFRASVGEPVRSTGAGVVVSAGRSGGYGNMVEIDHGQGVTTRYGHLSKIIVREGDTIVAGQNVGLAGSTGRSTGPHLHYEVRLDGKPVDPVRFLNAGSKLRPLLEG